MGRLRIKASKNKGYVLLDVLTGIFIASIALLLVFGSLVYTSMISARIGKRAFDLISSKNDYDEQRNYIFTEEYFKE